MTADKISGGPETNKHENNYLNYFFVLVLNTDFVWQTLSLIGSTEFESRLIC